MKRLFENVGENQFRLIKEIDFSSKITFERICPLCKRKNSITVDKNDYEKWHSGTLIQRAFPYLSPAEREMLKTGICDTCWKELFGSS